MKRRGSTATLLAHNAPAYRRHLTQALSHLELAYNKRPALRVQGWTMDEEAFVIQAETMIAKLLQQSLDRDPPAGGTR